MPAKAADDTASDACKLAFLKCESLTFTFYDGIFSDQAVLGVQFRHGWPRLNWTRTEAHATYPRCTVPHIYNKQNKWYLVPTQVLFRCINAETVSL